MNCGRCGKEMKRKEITQFEYDGASQDFHYSCMLKEDRTNRRRLRRLLAPHPNSKQFSLLSQG